MLPNSVQTQTAGSTLVAALAGYAAAKGWLGLDATAWTALIVAALAAWPMFVTRLQSLKNTVGKSGALVVTSKASADAAPSPNVVSADKVSTLNVAAAK